MPIEDQVIRDERYNPEQVEKKWFERWQQDATLYAAEPDSIKPKYYVLEMLPYPSGALHMGHVRNYAIGDALARYMWMNGYNVLHPMGWDSFGLPAENAAISAKVPPREWTLRNIANMKAQMKRLGFGYDWSREVTTCLPDYYKWNQWFFLKLYERGLAYRKKSRVNWCPKCATVLANEQVVGGCCWRHEDTLVEQRELEQWFLRTTKYADELLRDIDYLPGWPEKVRTMQRNWIGRSEGAQVDFRLDALSGEKISVFTTRVDTIFGATSVQLAPQHAITEKLASADPELRKKVDQLIAEQAKAREIGDIGNIEKHGVNTGHFAVNPFNGEKVPVWVANYILMDYGTGAIMSVPAHDERDYEFAKKYGIDIRQVILPEKNANGGAGVPARLEKNVHVAPDVHVREGGDGGTPPPTRTSFHHSRWQAHQLRRIHWTHLRPGNQEDVRLRRAAWLRQSHSHFPFERLGHLPTALLGNADPDGLLRERWSSPRPRKRFANHLARRRRDYISRRIAAATRA
jgi:leucyl-tRNA synthetase